MLDAYCAWNVGRRELSFCSGACFFRPFDATTKSGNRLGSLGWRLDVGGYAEMCSLE